MDTPHHDELTSGHTPSNIHGHTSNEPTSLKQKLVWNTQTEELVASWGDIASCYKWLHDQAFRKYNKINYRMSIPVIVLSTVTGTVSVGMQSLVPPEWVNYAQQMVGAVNIITGIITTLQNFFRFAQVSEGHQHASTGWSKLERNIRIELKIDRLYRKDADSFMKVCRAEYDRLLEQSPVIPKDVLLKFRSKFKHSSLIRPDICDNLQKTEIAPVQAPPLEEPILPPIEEEDPSPTMLEEQKIVLDEIKTLLQESRLVPVGVRDADLPRWKQTPAAKRSSIDLSYLAPRKSFLGPPKQPIVIDTGGISVKDRIKQFNTIAPEPLTSRSTSSSISSTITSNLTSSSISSNLPSNLTSNNLTSTVLGTTLTSPHTQNVQHVQKKDGGLSLDIVSEMVMATPVVTPKGTPRVMTQRPSVSVSSIESVSRVVRESVDRGADADEEGDPDTESEV